MRLPRSSNLAACDLGACGLGNESRLGDARETEPRKAPKDSRSRCTVASAALLDSSCVLGAGEQGGILLFGRSIGPDCPPCVIGPPEAVLHFEAPRSLLNY
jgi:hypothetical protein